MIWQQTEIQGHVLLFAQSATPLFCSRHIPVIQEIDCIKYLQMFFTTNIFERDSVAPIHDQKQDTFVFADLACLFFLVGTRSNIALQGRGRSHHFYRDVSYTHLSRSDTAVQCSHGCSDMYYAVLGAEIYRFLHFDTSPIHYSQIL